MDIENDKTGSAYLEEQVNCIMQDVECIDISGGNVYPAYANQITMFPIPNEAKAIVLGQLSRIHNFGDGSLVLINKFYITQKPKDKGLWIYRKLNSRPNPAYIGEIEEGEIYGLNYNTASLNFCIKSGVDDNEESIIQINSRVRNIGVWVGFLFDETTIIQ